MKKIYRERESCYTKANEGYHIIKELEKVVLTKPSFQYEKNLLLNSYMKFWVR